MAEFPITYFTLALATKPKEGAILTAAMITCHVCCCVLAGMGGPRKVICVKCLDAIQGTRRPPTMEEWDRYG